MLDHQKTHKLKIILLVAFDNAAGYRVGELIYADENNNVHLDCSGKEIVVPHTDILEEDIRL